MDKKDRNYIPPRNVRNNAHSSYGRRVSHSEYDAERAANELREKRTQQKEEQAHKKRRKRKRMRAMRIRALCALGVAVIVIFIVLFFTPLLDIQGFNIMGNSIVETEEILTRLDKLKGTNLITLSQRDVKNELSDISYIEDAEISKFLIPPSATITVKECIPAMKIDVNGYDVVIDPQLKVLSDGGEFDSEALPHVDGLSIKKYSVGKVLEASDENAEKLEILSSCLETMGSLGMLGELDYIDLTNVTNIRFGYDDRIDALCGTRLEIERKIRMFHATVTGNNLEDNAHGTIDLSTVGKAIYLP